MVPSIDDHQIFYPAGDVQLAVDIDAEVARTEPDGARLSAGGVTALIQARLQLVTEADLGLLRATPVSATNVVAVQPDFADLPVG
ncbi:Uncharacterised protein [Mycobacteroides abscessus subsp. abscessus]|nr:Uncharacterised protein [Mycobacteroides abscessus subsp. abscessus]